MTNTKKVLLCEDDEGVRETVILILELNGYTVEAVTKAGQVWDKLTEGSPGLILIDLWLPDGNGDEFIRKLKKDENYSNIPVILFSANMQVKEIARDCGADDYLTKPFEIETLEEKVKANILG